MTITANNPFTFIESQERYFKHVLEKEKDEKSNLTDATGSEAGQKFLSEALFSLRVSISTNHQNKTTGG